MCANSPTRGYRKFRGERLVLPFSRVIREKKHRGPFDTATGATVQYIVIPPCSTFRDLTSLEVQIPCSNYDSVSYVVSAMHLWRCRYLCCGICGDAVSAILYLRSMLYLWRCGICGDAGCCICDAVSVAMLYLAMLYLPCGILRRQTERTGRARFSEGRRRW